MQPLDDLIAGARAAAEGRGAVAAGAAMSATRAPNASEAEVARVMQICNACRYCEGYCAVFPAMTRRLDFTTADVQYLANLCHNCGACLYACQYAPPHAFAVNVPQAMARVRTETWRERAWPPAFAALQARPAATVGIAAVASIALFVAFVLPNGTHATAPNGLFYAVIPHAAMAWIFATAFAWVVVALGIGVRRYWQAISPMHDPSAAAGAAPVGRSLRAQAGAETTRDVLALTYLGGGHGQGCNDTDDRFTPWRRRWHQVTLYGFVLCFASTCVATVYHYALGRAAPYPLLSLPVLLGTAGGIGLVAGPIGQWWLARRRDAALGDERQRSMDAGLVALLLLTSLTGLALLAARATAAMPMLLAVHLGAVLALFATMPYGKFAHGAFRTAALVKYAIEKRLPLRTAVSGE